MQNWTENSGRYLEMSKIISISKNCYDSTIIIIKKDRQMIAQFCGNDIFGQIDFSIVKSYTISHDFNKRERIITLEV